MKQQGMNTSMKLKFLGLLLIGCIFGLLVFGILNSKTDQENNKDRYEKVANSVVELRQIDETTKGGVATLGTGIIYDQDRHIITNAHVVNDNIQMLVRFNDTSLRYATVVAKDEMQDIAVLEIDGDLPDSVHAAKFRMNIPEVGASVHSLGSPYYLEKTFSSGIISGDPRAINIFEVKNPYYIFVYQMDMPVYPGNSGGPLFNEQGDVLGMTSLNISNAENISFAIPANKIKGVVDDLLLNQTTSHPMLYLVVKDTKNDRDGAVVVERRALSPLSDEQIKKGDIIVKVNDVSVRNPEHLAAILHQLRPESVVHLVIEKEVKQKSSQATSEESPSSDDKDSTVMNEEVSVQVSVIDSAKHFSLNDSAHICDAPGVGGNILGECEQLLL